MADKTLSGLVNELTVPTTNDFWMWLQNAGGTTDYKATMKNFRKFMGAYSATKTADFTIADSDPYGTYVCNNVANDKLVATLPTAADNTDAVISFEKGSANYGTVVVEGEGSETINGWDNIALFRQYEKVTVRSTGTEWVVINGWSWLIKSGPINTSDWTERDIGLIELVGTITGTFERWETVTEETSGYRGIVIDIDTNIYIVWIDDGSGGVGGFFTNGRDVTGESSGAVIALTANTKNVDSDVCHGINRAVDLFDFRAFHTTDGTEANKSKIDQIAAVGSSELGASVHGIDLDSFLFETETDGLQYMTAVNAWSVLSTDDEFYELTLKLS